MARLANQKHGEVCLICEKNQQTGIHIFNQFICEACERKVISTETNDSQYLFYLKQLEKLKTTMNKSEKR